MAEYIEFTDKTLEDAITAACRKLEVTSDRLDYVVVEHGRSGFLGFNAKPAVIKARVKETSADTDAVLAGVLERAEKSIAASEEKASAAASEAAAAVESSAASIASASAASAAAAATASAAATAASSAAANASDTVKAAVSEAASAISSASEGFAASAAADAKEASVSEKADASETGRTAAAEGRENGRNEGRRSRRRNGDRRRNRGSRENAEAEGAEARPERPAKADNGSRERRRKKDERPLTEEEIAMVKERADKFLTDVFGAMGMEVTINQDFDPSDNILTVEVEGDDMGILIGKRGQTLDSLQYLVSLVVNKGLNTYVHVKADTENYRERRKKTLENLAKNVASKVKRTRRPQTLEPMNPYERRVIHSALQGDRYVTTYSEGEEPFRHVVVTMKKDDRYDRQEQEQDQDFGAEEEI